MNDYHRILNKTVRLGRKLVDVVGWVNGLEKLGIQFVSIKENFNVNDLLSSYTK